MAATIATDDTEALAAARAAMVVSQLRPNAVTDAALIAAIGRIPRETFVPAHYGTLAYRDRPLTLEGGRELNAPLATARLINEAGVRPGQSVLLVGAAGGYAAALLAALGAQVTALELPGVAHQPVEGVTWVEGALPEGHAAGAPYDAIIVDGAVEVLPEALADQVRIGGIIVAGLVDRGVARLARGTRTEGGFALVPFADIDCVVLPGFARPRQFQFPG